MKYARQQQLWFLIYSIRECTEHAKRRQALPRLHTRNDGSINTCPIGKLLLRDANARTRGFQMRRKGFQQCEVAGLGHAWTVLLLLRISNGLLAPAKKHIMLAG